jgi:hypothetical protein
MFLIQKLDVTLRNYAGCQSMNLNGCLLQSGDVQFCIEFTDRMSGSRLLIQAV